MLGISDNKAEAEKILSEVFKEFGLGRKKKEKTDIRIRIAGPKEWSDPNEVIAYAIDKNYKGIGNDITRSIEDAFMRRVKKYAQS